MKQYGIYCSDEAYYGVDFSWEQFISNYGKYDKPCKEQIIDILENEIDIISKFILPREILDFTTALKDDLTGNELYNHLCENLEFITKIINRAGEISRELRSKTYQIIFGECVPYSTEDDCHLILFRDNGAKRNLNFWLKNNEDFIDIFKSYLANIDGDLFKILFENANAKELVEKDVKEKVDSFQRTIDYHKKQILELENRIITENERLKAFD